MTSLTSSPFWIVAAPPDLLFHAQAGHEQREHFEERDEGIDRIAREGARRGKAVVAGVHTATANGVELSRLAQNQRERRAEDHRCAGEVAEYRLASLPARIRH